jgi:hypothetical protein
MTTYTAFKPNSTQPFSFRASVGGTTLTVAVPYNLYANRYYVKMVNGQGESQGYVPLVASPDDYDINLALGVGAGSLVYRASTNQFEAT